MENKQSATGHCLCGEVTLAAAALSKHVGACHCNMCRIWGGGAFMALDAGIDVRITGEDHVSVFSSSEWAERGFCSRCGTNLFYRLKQNGQYIVSAGLFDQSVDLEMDHQIFIDEKPAYYDFVQKTKNMTGAEVFAQFAPPS